MVVNLYPFEATVARGADFPTCVENIDIGGPALIRASAKNHDFVTVVVDPADYTAVLDELAAHKGATTLALRRKLAAKAYARTAAYNSAIATWFARQQGETFPERLTLAAERVQILRYGENPHQQAAFYADGSKRPGVATARQVQGKELSLQQHQRHRRGLRMRRRVQRAGGRRDQARQPVRRGDRARPVQRLSQGLCLRSGVDLWRHRRGQPHARSGDRDRPRQALPRSDHRARRDAARRSRSWRGARTCACCWPARCPIRRAPA